MHLWVKKILAVHSSRIGYKHKAEIDFVSSVNLKKCDTRLMILALFA